MTTRILSTFKALAAGSVFGLFAIIATLTVTSAASTTYAGELDSEVVNKQALDQALRAKELPGTVVVRVSEKGEASILETTEKLNQDANTVAALHKAEFKSITTAGAATATAELNRDSGASSWFAYFPNYGRSYGWAPTYYAPVYYSAGYTYAYYNCYQYNYYGYAYYWYRW